MALPPRAPGEEPGGHTLAYRLPRTSAGAPQRPSWDHSLAEEALGDSAQFSPTVLDQVHLLVHHHVVKLLSLLRNHDVGVPLHAQLQAYGGGTVSTQASTSPGEQRGAGPQFLEAPTGVTYRVLIECQPLLQAPASDSLHNLRGAAGSPIS